MPFTFPEIKQFPGLSLQRNSLETPAGSLEVASNVNISKDNIVSSRRGLYKYFTPGTGTLNRLFTFNGKLLACFNNKISYFTDTGSSPSYTGTETTLTGATVAVSTIGTSRSFLSNSNFYFTTDNGPLKLTDYNSTIYPAGIPQALDLVARLVVGSSSTFLTVGNIVGYRMVFGLNDANSNLILGAPGDIVTVANTANSGKSYTSAGAGPYTITVTSTAHGLTTGMYLTFSAGSSGNANGTYQITVTTADAFTYSVASDPTTGTLTYGYACPVRLEGSIPSEITAGMSAFVQIYRTTQQATSTGIFSDFKLLAQRDLTSAEITAGRLFYTDTLSDVLLGAYLYTNENSGQGEAQKNYRPPLCKTVAVFKGIALYGNCTTRQLLNLNVVDSTAISASDYIEVSVSAAVRRYVFVAGIGNQTVRATCSSSSGLLVTYTSHGFSNDWYVYVSNQTGGSIADGFYYVVSSAANTFKLSLTQGGSAVAFASETSLEVSGVHNGTYYIAAFDAASSSASVRLDTTARAIVRAINRDPSSVVYANYISGYTDVPGKLQLQAKGFGAAMYLRASAATPAAAFSPVLPTSFVSGTQVYSRNSTLLNSFFAAKVGEPEAVPLVNVFGAGAANEELLIIAPLRDSCILVKEDGVFRMTGDSVYNLTITALDTTVICLAPNTVQVINNQVVFLSNQGVCLVTESSVDIVSRSIEDVIQPILGQSGLAGQTSSIAYETERMYLLCTTTPSSTTAEVVYAYNLLTGAWTSWDLTFTQGTIGPGDKLYAFGSANDIVRERKDQSRIDFAGQNYSATITGMAADGLSGVVTVSGYAPKTGDMLVKSGVITWITGVTSVSGSSYTCSFHRDTNIADADSVTLYSAFTKRVKLSPVHCGLVGREKFFSQMAVHTKDSNISRAYVYFTNDSFSGSEITDWSPNFETLETDGWGNAPWGFFPWGQEDGITIQSGTLPAAIMRLYVPSYAARCSFIQPVFEFPNAGDMLNIQSISFAVRAYGERESK